MIKTTLITAVIAGIVLTAAISVVWAIMTFAVKIHPALPPVVMLAMIIIIIAVSVGKMVKQQFEENIRGTTQDNNDDGKEGVD